MGRADVLQAVAQFINGAGIQHLGKLFPYAPKITTEAAFFSQSVPGDPMGAIIYTFFPRQSEHRIALGGPTSGAKMVRYELLMMVLFRTRTETAEEAGAENDAFLDSLAAAIRANRTTGNSQVVFQWGEGDDIYGEDIKIESSVPRELRLGVTQIYSTVEVVVLEQVTT